MNFRLPLRIVFGGHLAILLISIILILLPDTPENSTIILFALLVTWVASLILALVQLARKEEHILPYVVLVYCVLTFLAAIIFITRRRII